MSEADNLKKIRFYGRRKGRTLSQHQQDLMENTLPQFRLNLPEAGQDLNLDDVAKRKEVWLEIGFGNGEHLVHQAIQHPDVSMIGCDAFENAASMLLKKVIDNHLQNIYIVHDDARKLVAALPDASVDRIFVLFPDPWPKLRHHKRRILQDDFIRALARILKPEGIFRFASDIEDYVQQVWTTMREQALFKMPDGELTDWQTQPEGWVETKYEQRGKRLNHVCHYLDFRK